jgi:hypothetical protein
MEQRPLRLGDIVDDYCPRERRITNHAIVAIVEDNIRQTRCATCDAEHVYKDGKAPRRRKGDDAADPPLGQIAPRPVVVAESDSPEDDSLVEPPMTEDAPAMAASSDGPGDDGQPGPGNELWPAHRTLIRASLPKVEGEQPPPRPIPEFTMHQRPVGRGHFRGGGGGSWNGGSSHFRQGRPQGHQGQGEVNGNTVHGHGGSRHGGGHSQNGPSRPQGSDGHSSGFGGPGQGGGGQANGHPGGGGRPGGGGGRHRHRGGRHKNPR